MEYSEKIINRITNSGRTKSSVAIAIGCNKSLFSQWEKKPTSKISLDIAVKISKHLKITLDDLLFDTPSLSQTDEELLDVFHTLPRNERLKFIGRCSEISLRLREAEKIKVIHTNYISMPIAEVAAGAGISTPFYENNMFSKQDFPESVVPSNAECGIPISGDSMEPVYPDGCIVWVKKGFGANYGDVVIAILDGCPYCKIYDKAGLRSYNSMYPIRKVTDGNTFSIFGKVVGKYIPDESE